MSSGFVPVGGIHTVDAFQAHLRKLDITIPVDRDLLAGAAFFPVNPHMQTFEGDRCNSGAVRTSGG